MGESFKESVMLAFRLAPESPQQVRYFYGEDAEKKAETYLQNFVKPPVWHETYRITKKTERIGGSK